MRRIQQYMENGLASPNQAEFCSYRTSAVLSK